MELQKFKCFETKKEIFMFIIRKRLRYLILVIGVIIIGLFSRELSSLFPKWVGSILWGLMVFFIMGFIFKDRTTLYNGMVSIVFSIGVEVAKLYHTPWIDAFRYTKIGGLLLGHVFSWNNIFLYITGIALGAICEKLWLRPLNNK
jgi:hypothetical protein